MQYDEYLAPLIVDIFIIFPHFKLLYNFNNHSETE